MAVIQTFLRPGSPSTTEGYLKNPVPEERTRIDLEEPSSRREQVLDVNRKLFAANRQALEALKPKEPFDLPAARVATKFPTVFEEWVASVFRANVTRNKTSPKCGVIGPSRLSRLSFKFRLDLYSRMDRVSEVLP